MSDGVAPEIGTILVGETRTIAISFEGMLDSLNEEELTGTPTFAQYKRNAAGTAWEVSTDLTVNSAAVNGSPVLIGANTIREGAAVLARVVGTSAVANARYRLVCTAGTTSTPAQVLLGVVHLDAVGVA